MMERDATLPKNAAGRSISVRSSGHLLPSQSARGGSGRLCRLAYYLRGVRTQAEVLLEIAPPLGLGLGLGLG